MPTSNLKPQTSNLLRQTFSKEERLTSKKLIEKVSTAGKSISFPPFRLKWIKAELNIKYPAQLAISVPKKNFKRAVDRNRIKRLIREVYRKNKSGFYEMLTKHKSRSVLLMSYTGKVIPEYKEVEEKIKLLLSRFQKDYEKDSHPDSR